MFYDLHFFNIILFISRRQFNCQDCRAAIGDRTRDARFQTPDVNHSAKRDSSRLVRILVLYFLFIMLKKSLGYLSVYICFTTISSICFQLMSMYANGVIIHNGCKYMLIQAVVTTIVYVFIETQSERILHKDT